MPRPGSERSEKPPSIDSARRRMFRRPCPAERYGRVPRYYIGCAEDRVVTPEMQRRASAGLPASRVYGLASDHSPFFTAPAELANCLDKIANES